MGGRRCSSRGMPRTGPVRVRSEAGCGVGVCALGRLFHRRHGRSEPGRMGRLCWVMKMRKGILGRRNDISLGTEVSVSSMTTDKVGTQAFSQNPFLAGRGLIPPLWNKLVQSFYLENIFFCYFLPLLYSEKSNPKVKNKV